MELQVRPATYEEVRSYEALMHSEAAVPGGTSSADVEANIRARAEMIAAEFPALEWRGLKPSDFGKGTFQIMTHWFDTLHLAVNGVPRNSEDIPRYIAAPSPLLFSEEFMKSFAQHLRDNTAGCTVFIAYLTAPGAQEMPVGGIGVAFAQIKNARVGVFEGIHKLPSFRMFKRFEIDYVLTVLSAIIDWGVANKVDILSVLPPVGPKTSSGTLVVPDKLGEAGFLSVDSREGQAALAEFAARSGVDLEWSLVRKGTIDLARYFGCREACLSNRFFHVFNIGIESAFVKLLRLTESGHEDSDMQ